MQQLQQFVKTYGQKTTFHSSKYIFKTGEAPSHFYFLEEGYVKILQESETGQAITLAIFKSGDFFGLADLFAQVKIRECSAISINSASFYAISQEQLKEYIHTDSILTEQISQVLANKIIEKHQHIITITSLTVEKRISKFLQQFAIQHANGEFHVNIPLTHEEISHYVNCSRQKVTSYLNEWRKKGFISYERGNIQIRQPDALFI